MSTRVKVEMQPIQQILKNHGLDSNGRVQLYVTNMISRRMTRYQYYGKVMVNSATGKGPAYIPNVGYRYRKGTVLRVTDRDLEYDKTKNPDAGPFWDRALLAKEKSQMIQEVQRYIDGTG